MATTTSLGFERDIPGPSPAPVLSWLPFLLQFGRDPLGTLENLRKQYGDLIRLGFKDYSAIVIFAPEYNRQVLRDPTAFYSYDLDLVPVPFPKDSAIRHITNGLPLMNGPRHDEHRAALLPYFHKKFISRYYDGCVDVTERKIVSWRMGAELDMRDEMEQLAIWLATAPVLGLDPEGEGEAIGRQLERTLKLLLNPATLLFPYNIPGSSFHALLKAAEETERLTLEVIARKKRAGLTGNDILSIMIQMHEEDPLQMDLNELVGHTAVMFRGGYNPNGMALYWTLLLLSQHPEASMKLTEELHAAGGNAPPLETLDRLPYLEAVIKEGMRLFPAGTWTARLAMQDFEMDSHPLPKGTWILMSPYITQRIPEIFADPYCFKPERWFSSHYSSYEFMPFSAGPRYCLGASLSMLQLKIALSILVQRFSFTLKPDTRVDCIGLNSIRPKNGLAMIVNPAGARNPRVSLKGNIHKIVHFS